MIVFSDKELKDFDNVWMRNGFQQFKFFPIIGNALNIWFPNDFCGKFFVWFLVKDPFDNSLASLYDIEFLLMNFSFRFFTSPMISFSRYFEYSSCWGDMFPNLNLVFKVKKSGLSFSRTGRAFRFLFLKNFRKLHYFWIFSDNAP